MKYLALIVATEAKQDLSSTQELAWIPEIIAWYDKWNATPKLVGGAQLQAPETAKTIQAPWGVIDGPFSETGAAFVGYSVLETDTIDEAVEIARTWPGADRGLVTIEVRPVWGIWPTD